MKKIFIFLILISFELTSAPKSYPVLVYSALRDSRGLIWMGTEDDLLLFQGNRFVNYAHSTNDSNSIIGGRIYSLAEDGKGNIWAATFTNGITVFNPVKNKYRFLTAKSHPALLSNRTMNTMSYLGHNEMLLNTEQGCFKVNTNNFSYKAVLSKKYNSLNILLHKKFNGKDYFLIQGTGLLEVDRYGREKLFTVPTDESNFMGLATVGKKLYLSGFKGVFIFQKDSLIHLQMKYKDKSISDEAINDMIEDKDHNTYINSLTYGMLKVYEYKNEFYCTDVDNSGWYKSGNTLYSNFYDSVGNAFYVGTQQGLFMHKVKASYCSELVKDGENVGTVRALLFCKGKLLVGSESGCFSLDKKLTMLKEEHAPKRKGIYTLFETKSDEVFAAGNKLVKVDHKLLSAFACNEKISNAESVTISGVLNDSIIFVIPSNSNDIFFHDLNSKNYTQAKIAVDATFTYPVHLWKQGILLNCFNGLYYYNSQTGSCEKMTKKDDTEIADFKVKDNNIFYSSKTNGIIILDSNFRQQKKIDISPVSNTNEVRAFEIVDSVIWFSSAAGIGYYDLRKSKMAYFKSGEIFTTTNFLNSSVTSHNDTIYFGGDNGVVAVNTEAILQHQELSKCYLLDISVYESGQLLKVVNPIGHTFNHTQNNLEIRLIRTITDFSTFKHYTYKLNGNSEIPIDDEGIIKLYNLSPDNYNLKIYEIESGNRVCNYSFVVAPPWYQTWWFRLAIGIVILANVIWISRLYFKRKIIAQQKELEKQQALQSERDRISIDMHDDLGSGLSSIKLISEMLKKKHSDTETKSDLNEIVDHATELTSTMREMVWSLNPRNDLLSKFTDHAVDYAKYFFEPSEINFQITVTPDIPEMIMNGFVRRNLFLCLKEIFNNIIKHADAKNVNCTISYINSILHIVIQDDGKGIAENHREGNGLYSLQSRMVACKGHIEWRNMKPGLCTEIRMPI